MKRVDQPTIEWSVLYPDRFCNSEIFFAYFKTFLTILMSIIFTKVRFFKLNLVFLLFVVTGDDAEENLVKNQCLAPHFSYMAPFVLGGACSITCAQHYQHAVTDMVT